MKPLSIITAILLTVALVPQAFADPNGDSLRLADRLVVSVDPAGSLQTFVTAFETAHTDVQLNLLESLTFDPPAGLLAPNQLAFFPRRLHKLEVVLPPGADEAFIDALELDLPNYLNAAMLNGADFEYTSETGEGHTGSTWVDGINPGAMATQFAADQIGLGAAHQRSRGEAVTVAVLDTGLDGTHPGLGGRVLANGFNFVNDTSDTSEGGDGNDTDGDGDIDEMVGHGTYVAGIIHLVAPDAAILPVRVLNGDGLTDSWTIVEGLYFAMERGVEVINLSLGSTYRSELIENAVEDACWLGIPVIAAAGNLDRSEPEEFPAMRGGFGVASLDAMGVKSSFSNYSDRLFLSGPGGCLGAVYDPATCIVSTLPKGAYGTWGGTSFATAFVTGATALLRGQYPDLDSVPGALPNDGYEAVSNFVTDRLMDTATDIYPQNPQHAANQELGAGRVHAGSAAALGPIALREGDINNDGIVDAIDYLRVISDWGTVYSPADLNGDGIVDALDFLRMLANWG